MHTVLYMYTIEPRILTVQFLGRARKLAKQISDVSVATSSQDAEPSLRQILQAAGQDRGRAKDLKKDTKRLIRRDLRTFFF